MQVRSRTVNDRYIVLGSDGLFERMKDLEISQIIHSFMASNSDQQNGSNILAEKLGVAALNCWKNVSKIFMGTRLGSTEMI